MSHLQNPIRQPKQRAQTGALPVIVQHQVPMLEDDVYAELYLAARRPPLLRPLMMRLNYRSSSKCWHRYRVGWVVGGRYAQEISRLKLIPFPLSPPSRHCYFTVATTAIA